MTQTCQVCLAQLAMPGVIAEGKWHSAGLAWPIAALQPQQSSTEFPGHSTAASHLGDKGYVGSSQALLTSCM